MEVLKAKVRCASSTENEPQEEPQEKRTRTDDNNNVSLQTMYEEILQENTTNELNQSQADQQVIDLLFK